jgi:hypothetical protein
MRVQWADGVRSGGVKPEAAVVVFGTLAAAGRLTTDAVVEEARPIDAPLHPAFEWRDDRAAHLYRLDQARHLIRALVITPDTGESVPIYVHVSDVGRYETTVALVQDLTRWSLAYEDARRDLGAAASKMRALDSLAEDGAKSAAIARALAALGVAIGEMEEVRQAAVG